MGAMKTILFSLATTDTAGPSADVSVPTRKSTLSLRIISRATRTASSGWPLVSRMTSSILRPSTPPLALISSTNICAPLDAGSPKRAPGPERMMGKPTLMGFCALAPSGTSRAAARSAPRTMRRCMNTPPCLAMRLEHRESGRLDANAIEGRRCGDEERAIVVIAPREVGRALGRLDDLAQRARRIEHVNTAGAAAVHVARGIDLHPVGRPRLVTPGLRPHAALRERPAGGDVEDADVLAGGVVDEELPLVEGEAEPVGTVEVVHEQLRRLGIGAHAVDALEVQLLRPLDAEELRAAVGWVAEVDGAVALAHDVIRAVELLAPVVRGDRDEGAVWTRERHPAGRVLAGEEPSLAVVRQAVGHVAGLAERGHAVLGRPAPHVIAGHVAPEQELARRMPQRPLGEEEPGAELLERVRHFLTG